LYYQTVDYLSTTPMIGRIFLTDLIVRTNVGITTHERRHQQDVVLTISCDVDISNAVAEDDIAATLNYATLHADILTLAHDRQFHLLERMTDAIATLCLENSRVLRVRVSAAKPRKLPGCAAVGVELTKWRGACHELARTE
jgi:dihydroneopterin aldolase